MDLHDLDFAGLDLRGKRFQDSIVYGLQLWRGEQHPVTGAVDPETEVRTDIRETDWTNAKVGSVGAETFFGRVNAEGAVFGFAESLTDRRQRHAASGVQLTDLDSGGYHTFNGAEGGLPSDDVAEH